MRRRPLGRRPPRPAPSPVHRGAHAAACPAASAERNGMASAASCTSRGRARSRSSRRLRTISREPSARPRARTPACCSRASPRTGSRSATNSCRHGESPGRSRASSGCIEWWLITEFAIGSRRTLQKSGMKGGGFTKRACAATSGSIWERPRARILVAGSAQSCKGAFALSTRAAGRSQPTERTGTATASTSAPPPARATTTRMAPSACVETATGDACSSRAWRRDGPSAPKRSRWPWTANHQTGMIPWWAKCERR
mmetsp:Transcript_1472/g.3878  ORF Transcript_1472/g.3878 Transcript_1472/m.3878 type:complete len:256 (+) Transcript_1472:173-940(+)